MAVNPITTVGWVMALLWAIFFVLTVVYFEEPAKRYVHSLVAQPNARTLSC